MGIHRCNCHEVVGQGYCEKHHCTYQVLNSPDSGCQMCRMEREGPMLKEMLKQMFEDMSLEDKKKFTKMRRKTIKDLHIE